jgi:hypothetical protein
MVSKNQHQDSFLLIDETPIVILRSLLAICTESEAKVLQQIHYWLCINTRGKKGIVDGVTWVYITYEKLAEQLAMQNMKTAQRAVKRLESLGILISDNFNRVKYDKTKWYRIDYDRLEKLLESNVGLRRPYLIHVDKMSKPIHKNKEESNEENKMDLLSKKNQYPKTIILIVDNYINQMYIRYKKELHPTITDSQYNQVCKNLSEFAYDCFDLSKEELNKFDQEVYKYLFLMAELFFERVKHSNHSIIHFSQSKILENRHYELFYGQYKSI